MSQPQVSHHQVSFNEGLNKQYLPNYVNQYQSPVGSIPGQDLSAPLMELANIQSRSLEMMAASQRSQQKAFQELTRASRDKANNAMFTSKFLTAQTDKFLKIGSMKLTKLVEQVIEISGPKPSRNPQELCDKWSYPVMNSQMMN